MSRRFTPLFAIALALGLAASVLAQRDRDTYSAASPSAFEVSGQVRFAENGLPAGNTLVRLEFFGGGVVDSSQTDSRGRFRFPNLPRGYYRVIIKAPGYHHVQQDADLQVVFRAHLMFDLVKDESGSLKFVDVIDAKAPPEAREELFRARTALARRSNDEALVHLQKAIGLFPNFYQAHLLLGTTYLDTKEWEKAEQSLNQALQVKADSPVVLLALGEVYWRQKRYEESEKALLDGLKLDDGSWPGYFTLSRLYWDRGQIGKAAPAIGRTLQLKPDFAEAHLLAGNILLRVDQRERALTAYKEYLRLQPTGEFAPATRELVEKLSKTIGENKKSLN